MYIFFEQCQLCWEACCSLKGPETVRISIAKFTCISIKWSFKTCWREIWLYLPLNVDCCYLWWFFFQEISNSFFEHAIGEVMWAICCSRHIASLDFMFSLGTGFYFLQFPFNGSINSLPLDQKCNFKGWLQIGGD